MSIYARQLRHVRKRRQHGFCGYAGCPNRSETFYCPFCAARINEQRRARRKAAKVRKEPAVAA